MRKKCKNCKEVRDDFSKNRYSTDGHSSTCKECSKILTQMSRRRLSVMIKRVDKKHHETFSQLHRRWMLDGYPPHLKPLVVNDQVMTKSESKGIVVSRSRTKVEMITADGDVVKTFGSISHAMRETGASRVYIKWSSDNESEIDGRMRWRVKR